MYFTLLVLKHLGDEGMGVLEMMWRMKSKLYYCNLTTYMYLYTSTYL